MLRSTLSGLFTLLPLASALSLEIDSIAGDDDTFDSKWHGENIATTHPLTLTHAISKLYQSDLTYAIKQSFSLLERDYQDKASVNIDIVNAGRTSEFLSNWNLIADHFPSKNQNNHFKGNINLNIFTTDTIDQANCVTRDARMKIKCFAGMYHRFNSMEHKPDIIAYFNADIRHESFPATIAKILDSNAPALITMTGKATDSCSATGQHCFEVTEVFRSLGARALVDLYRNPMGQVFNDPRRGRYGKNMHAVVYGGRETNFAHGWHSATNVVRWLYLRDQAENYYAAKLQDRPFASWLAAKAEQMKRNELTSKYSLGMSLDAIMADLADFYQGEMLKCVMNNESGGNNWSSSPSCNVPV